MENGRNLKGNYIITIGRAPFFPLLHDGFRRVAVSLKKLGNLPHPPAELLRFDHLVSSALVNQRHIFCRWVFLKNDLPGDNCGKVEIITGFLLIFSEFAWGFLQWLRKRSFLRYVFAMENNMPLNMCISFNDLKF